jgi:hypothetical protein
VSSFLTPEQYDAYRKAIRMLGESKPGGIFDANDVTFLSVNLAGGFAVAPDIFSVLDYFANIGIVERLEPDPPGTAARWRYLGNAASPLT